MSSATASSRKNISICSKCLVVSQGLATAKPQTNCLLSRIASQVLKAFWDSLLAASSEWQASFRLQGFDVRSTSLSNSSIEISSFTIFTTQICNFNFNAFQSQRRSNWLYWLYRLYLQTLMSTKAQSIPCQAGWDQPRRPPRIRNGTEWHESGDCTRKALGTTLFAIILSDSIEASTSLRSYHAKYASHTGRGCPHKIDSGS